MRWRDFEGMPLSLDIVPDELEELPIVLDDELPDEVPDVVPDDVPDFPIVPDVPVSVLVDPEDDGDRSVELVPPLVCAHAGPAATSAPVMSTAKNVFHSFM